MELNFTKGTYEYLYHTSYKIKMYNILIILENSLDISNNGEINLLKNFLRNAPSDFNITITNIGVTAFSAEQININRINKNNKISILRKIFLSLTFNGCRKNKELIKVIKDNITLTQYEHIILFSNMANRYFRKCNLSSNNTSLIMTDLPSKAFEFYINNATNKISKIYYIKESIWCHFYERQILSRYKNVILVNKNEAAYANRKYKTKIFKHIPLVFSYPTFSPNICLCSENEIINVVFLGNMSFRPNIDGINYFYNNIFKKLPDCYRLHIIGKGSQNFFKEDERIITYGYVEDIGSILSKMQFGICYMVNGGGMKSKVFDYMKYGIPCIVNSYVCKNNTVNSDYIYKADNIDEFLIIVKENMNYNSDFVRDSIAEYEVGNVADRFWNLFR